MTTKATQTSVLPLYNDPNRNDHTHLNPAYDGASAAAIFANPWADIQSQNAPGWPARPAMAHLTAKKKEVSVEAPNRQPRRPEWAEKTQQAAIKTLPAHTGADAVLTASSLSFRRRLIFGVSAVAALVIFGAVLGSQLAKAKASATPSNTSVPWLFTQGNQIFAASTPWDGVGAKPSGATLFLGRGANIQDTRNCGVCAAPLPLSEVQRRIDAATATNGVNFLRLTLESDNSTTTLVNDANYAQDIKSLIDYVGSKGNTYLLVSVWHDPSLSDVGWPTPQTYPVLQKLVSLVGNQSHVLFGVSNEPQSNFNGGNDTLVYNAMNGAIGAIRQAEAALGSPRHVALAQGTRNWSADVNYYVDHPITAGNGTHIAYEVHAYFNQSAFAQYIDVPKKTLPLIIGEFGPNGQGMSIADATSGMQQWQKANIPHLAWNFHPQCGPSLLDDYTNASNCNGVGQPITLNNPWGKAWLMGMGQSWG